MIAGHQVDRRRAGSRTGGVFPAGRDRFLAPGADRLSASSQGAGRCWSGACFDARRQEAEFCSYVQEAAGWQGPADLRDRGVITAVEFDREKAKVLA